MERLFDYVRAMWYMPHLYEVLMKDKDGVYSINMKKWGELGITFLDEDKFNVVMLGLRAITKQDEIHLNYKMFRPADCESEEDIIKIEGGDEIVVWSETLKTYIELS